MGWLSKVASWRLVFPTHAQKTRMNGPPRVLVSDGDF